ncbi:RNA polymerase II transcription factor B 52 kDa subunit [Tilletia horrida]|nr:RNA polymerase II transcription factor B 52 kDa subunit [Tilletia horrida]KAK0559478.1 RNA polymerase II transcription factor B 52 kDa subunit [Tilletia horrida]
MASAAGASASGSSSSGASHESLDAFLNDLPKATLSRLYSTPSSALALFRLLPPLARQLVTHLLFLDGSVDRAELEAWIAPSAAAQSAFQTALRRLEALWIVSKLSPTAPKLTMSDQFKHSLRRALTGGGTHRSFGVPCDTPDANAVSVAFLDAYARSKWETILHFMVGSEGAAQPREPVLALLRSSSLMSGPSRAVSSLRITAKGFNFLLHDTNTQLWQLLLAYLSLTEKRNMDLVDVLAFLFMLGSLQLGRDYSTHELTETQLQMLDDFRDYGLVYQRKSSSRRFYPTRLATTLTSDAPALHATSRAISAAASSTNAPASGDLFDAAEQREAEAEPRGFIILETNYRLYAYTSNPLRIAVLSLFASLRARYPNLVVGNLTRDSIKTALANGIGADQIIAYLQHHAHEQMYKNNPLLPVTVTDQIRLWEREKNRVTFEQGSLWTDFTSEADYEMVRDYARSIQQLVWEDAENLRLFVAFEGHQPVRDFVSRRIQR